MAPWVIVGILGALWATGETPAKLVEDDNTRKDESVQVAVNSQAVKDQQVVFDNTLKLYHEAVESARIANARLSELQRENDAAKSKVIDSARQDAFMAGLALLALPVEKQTAETQLALRLINSCDSTLSVLLGDLSEQKRQQLASIISGALSKSDEERKKAEALLAEKDKELTKSLMSLASSSAKLEVQQALIAEKDKSVDLARKQTDEVKEELKQKTNELIKSARISAEKYANDVWFWRYFVIGFVAVLVITGRVLPKFEKYFGWVWLRPINKLNAWLFELITGQSISR